MKRNWCFDVAIIATVIYLTLGILPKISLAFGTERTEASMSSLLTYVLYALGIIAALVVISLLIDGREYIVSEWERRSEKEQMKLEQKKKENSDLVKVT